MALTIREEVQKFLSTSSIEQIESAKAAYSKMLAEGGLTGAGLTYYQLLTGLAPTQEQVSRAEALGAMTPVKQAASIGVPAYQVPARLQDLKAGDIIGGETMQDLWQIIGGNYTQTKAPPAGAIVPAGVDPNDPSTWNKMQAGLPAVIPAIGGIAGIGNFLIQNWPAIAGVLGIGAAGGAAGAGLTSLISGALPSIGGGGSTVVGGVPVGGPGVAEPPANMVAKQWVILTHSKTQGNYYIYFFKLIDGRIMCYNPGTGWKIWRPKKMIVLSPDPRLSQLGKLDRVYNKMMRRVAKKSKALKLAR